MQKNKQKKIFSCDDTRGRESHAGLRFAQVPIKRPKRRYYISIRRPEKRYHLSLLLYYRLLRYHLSFASIFLLITILFFFVKVCVLSLFCVYMILLLRYNVFIGLFIGLFMGLFVETRADLRPA